MRVLPLSFETAEENLAFEEWYFQHFTEDTIRIWRNPTSVVVGKHQNALAEVDLGYCLSKNIPVIRRISGGGTVYHDLGNINFSFFRSVEKEKMIDYVRNLDLIKAVLIELGFPVHMSERHDLFLNEFKVSGNAQHVRKGRALHHGTLLYDADLKALSKGIKRTSGHFVDKSVKSVRSPIFNLKNHRDYGNALKFEETLCMQLESMGLKVSLPETVDMKEIFKLVHEKYTQEEWNFGYSPKYLFEQTKDNQHVKLEVERGGTIKSVDVTENGTKKTELEQIMADQKHFFSEISSLLRQELNENEAEQWLKVLF